MSLSITDYRFEVPLGMYTTEAEGLLKGIVTYLCVRGVKTLRQLSQNVTLGKSWLRALKPGSRKWATFIKDCPWRLEPCMTEEAKKKFKTSYEWPTLFLDDILRKPDGELYFKTEGTIWFDKLSETDRDKVNPLERESISGADLSKLQDFKDRLAYDIYTAGKALLQQMQADELALSTVWWMDYHSNKIFKASLNMQKLEALRKLVEGSKPEGPIGVSLKGMPLNMVISSAIQVMDENLKRKTYMNDCTAKELRECIRRRFKTMRNALEERERVYEA